MDDSEQIKLGPVIRARITSQYVLQMQVPVNNDQPPVWNVNWHDVMPGLIPVEVIINKDLAMVNQGRKLLIQVGPPADRVRIIRRETRNVDHYLTEDQMVEINSS